MDNNYYNSKDLNLQDAHSYSGTVSWRSPSNIALIKYWGKKDRQIPLNPSISYTLSAAHTETTIKYSSKNGADKNWIRFSFEGKEELSFSNRIEKFFRSLIDIFPFISQLSFDISSQNSFPHSSGIASSASSMSALALCLCEIEQVIFGTLENDDNFFQKTSFVARLGSGSACRSLYPTMAVWGESEILKGSSDFFAVQYHDIDQYFQTFHDDILIISGEKKSVSSTAGHQLMNTNPFSDRRYLQAQENLKELIKAMTTKDLDRFGLIVEEEAMTLHALMMCSRPSYMLMKPNTIECINRIRHFREESKTPIFFTLDAGPNVHLLYPDDYQEPVKDFIKNELEPLTENNRIIEDIVGSGPKKLL